MADSEMLGGEMNAMLLAAFLVGPLPPQSVQADDWTREITVVRIVDGDTVDCLLDLGYDIQLKVRVRLSGIDAPEVRGKEKVKGLESSAHLLKLLKAHKGKLTVRPPKKQRGKFGRWLMVIYGGDVNLNQQMVKDGFAKEYHGGKR
jgi:micrococcal nuclease